MRIATDFRRLYSFFRESTKTVKDPEETSVREERPGILLACSKLCFERST